MSFELPDYVIYQGRWFSEDEDTPNYVRWSPWVVIPEWEYIAMCSKIKDGYKYQVRILKQVHIEGFGVDDTDRNPSVWYINPGL